MAPRGQTPTPEIRQPTQLVAPAQAPVTNLLYMEDFDPEVDHAFIER